MRSTMRDDLKAALKARDRVAVAALRSALAAIENAEALPAGEAVAGGSGSGSEHVAGAALGVGATEAERRHLTEADVRAIVAKEVRDRTEAAEEYARLDRPDAAARVQAEAEVLGRYLAADRG